MIVSIALAAYNGGTYIRKQVDSILNQTFHDFEHVACDDCSTDGTARAHYFDYWDNMEGVKIRNWGEFKEALESCALVSEDTHKKFAEYLDGNCCEKLWERIG